MAGKPYGWNLLVWTPAESLQELGFIRWRMSRVMAILVLLEIQRIGAGAEEFR